MQVGFKYKYCQGFDKMYNYGLKHFNPYTMITKKAKQRLKILERKRDQREKGSGTFLFGVRVI